MEPILHFTLIIVSIVWILVVGFLLVYGLLSIDKSSSTHIYITQSVASIQFIITIVDVIVRIYLLCKWVERETFKYIPKILSALNIFQVISMLVLIIGFFI